MTFIVYMDPTEIFICTPDSEEDLLKSQFPSKCKIIRDIKDYQRLEFDGEWLVAGAYKRYREGGRLADRRIAPGRNRLGIEGNGSQQLHMAYADIPRPISARPPGFWRSMLNALRGEA